MPPSHLLERTSKGQELDPRDQSLAPMVRPLATGLRPSGHMFWMRDGCWNRARSGGTDPPAINAGASAGTHGSHVEQGPIRAISDDQM